MISSASDTSAGSPATTAGIYTPSQQQQSVQAQQRREQQQRENHFHEGCSEERCEHVELLRRSLALSAFSEELGSVEADKLLKHLGTTKDSVIVEVRSMNVHAQDMHAYLSLLILICPKHCIE